MDGKIMNLDEINNKRVETTKLRVARAIKLLNIPIDWLSKGKKIDKIEIDIAHAVNLLEAANQEMQWACEHFKWNDEICIKIDDACSKLGNCLSKLIVEDDNDDDLDILSCDGSEALVILGKVLATLIRWFDDTADVSEV